MPRWGESGLGCPVAGRSIKVTQWRARENVGGVWRTKSSGRGADGDSPTLRLYFLTISCGLQMSERHLKYRKMNGIGNEILVVDLRAGDVRLAPAEISSLAADGRTHFDQLMMLRRARTPGTDAFVSIYNADGSPSATCGNGTRCIAAMVMAETGRDRATFETAGGVVTARDAGGGRITVDMGKPRLRWDEIPLAEEFRDTRAIELQIGPIDAPILHSPSVVSMGNPHAIFWVDDADAYKLEQIGPLLENHPIFPERANISLAEVRDAETIRLRVWERGAGLTRACGSAKSAPRRLDIMTLKALI